jgi:zinc/manganese transport system substrate-binding protein
MRLILEDVRLVRMQKHRSTIALASVLATLAIVMLLAGCGRSGPPPASGGSGGFEVVAAEDFWGSIAKQLAGDEASVTSIIVNPDTDPHSYEPNAADARTIAGANMAIVNGIGYDNWAPKLLQASPSSARVVLDVGDLLGLGRGENPHQWYSPQSVRRVVAQIVADYDRLDPRAAAYFAAREHLFLTRDLARYDALRSEIRRRYTGVAVGYSESIFQPLGADLGLHLLTPYSFAKAVAEGTDVTARDKQTVDTQARERLIKIWVFNSQNVTPDVQRVNEIAQQQKIPIATVTETLSPVSDSFEQWQVAELEGLARALHLATGR